MDTSHAANRFPALSRAVQTEYLAALPFSSREPDRYARSVAAVSAELGRRAHIPYIANIRPIVARPTIRASGDPGPTIDRAAADSDYGRFLGVVDVYSGTLCFDVWTMTDTAGISLGTDSASFDAADLEQILRRFDGTLVESAVAAVHRGPLIGISEHRRARGGPARVIGLGPVRRRVKHGNGR